VFERVNLLRWCWALPLSLPGLALWAVVRMAQGAQYARVHRVRGIVVFSVQGKLVERLLKLYPFFEPDALCIGCVVLARDEAMLAHLWVHELVHVRQALRWGILFPVLYLGASIWAVMRGQDAYYDNPFEREALLAEKAARENVQKKW
jgi:hypothetical protein